MPKSNILASENTQNYYGQSDPLTEFGQKSILTTVSDRFYQAGPNLKWLQLEQITILFNFCPTVKMQKAATTYFILFVSVCNCIY